MCIRDRVWAGLEADADEGERGIGILDRLLQGGNIVMKVRNVRCLSSSHRFLDRSGFLYVIFFLMKVLTGAVESGDEEE